MNELKVTNIEELKLKAQGTVVPLPGWDGSLFHARLKRPSMLGLVSSGKIPNSLLGAAQSVFTKGISESGVDIKEVYEIARTIAQEALSEPTLEQLNEIGLELTDEQLMAIMTFTQVGHKSLERFRPKQANSKNHKSKQKLQQGAK